jgi:hypothetical protein
MIPTESAARREFAEQIQHDSRVLAMSISEA